MRVMMIYIHLFFTVNEYGRKSTKHNRTTQTRKIKIQQ